jgi:hypothetical protein
VARIAMVAAVAVALLAPAGAAMAKDAAPAAKVAKPAPHKYRVAYAHWRKRLRHNHVYVGRNLLVEARREARASEEPVSRPTKGELRHSIHRMQRRWTHWLRRDPHGQVVAFKLKVRHKVPSWGKSHLASIAWCESKNDPHAIGGGGAYRGMYQFSFSTWAVVGGSGDPAAASRWELTWRAWLLLSQHGSGHWPVCG